MLCSIDTVKGWLLMKLSALSHHTPSYRKFCWRSDPHNYCICSALPKNVCSVCSVSITCKPCEGFHCYIFLAFVGFFSSMSGNYKCLYSLELFCFRSPKASKAQAHLKYGCRCKHVTFDTMSSWPGTQSGTYKWEFCSWICLLAKKIFEKPW